jgi:hypothetical protein
MEPLVDHRHHAIVTDFAGDGRALHDGRSRVSNVNSAIGTSK